MKILLFIFSIEIFQPFRVQPAIFTSSEKEKKRKKKTIKNIKIIFHFIISCVEFFVLLFRIDSNFIVLSALQDFWAVFYRIIWNQINWKWIPIRKHQKQSPDWRNHVNYLLCRRTETMNVLSKQLDGHPNVR